MLPIWSQHEHHSPHRGSIWGDPGKVQIIAHYFSFYFPHLNISLNILLQLGSSIDEAITDKRGKCNHPIQPYVLAVGDSKKLHTLILVLGDGVSIQLPRGTLPLRAFDLLFKVHFVFQSYFILGWKNVFRFVQLHICKLPITDEQVKNRHSTFMEQFKEIMAQAKGQWFL